MSELVTMLSSMFAKRCESYITIMEYFVPTLAPFQTVLRTKVLPPLVLLSPSSSHRLISEISQITQASSTKEHGTAARESIAQQPIRAASPFVKYNSPETLVHTRTHTHTHTHSHSHSHSHTTTASPVPCLPPAPPRSLKPASRLSLA